MASARAPLLAAFTLAAQDSLTGTVDGTQYLDLSGAEAVFIFQASRATAAAGRDVVEISFDDGKTFVAATAANVGVRSAGLLKSDGTAAASAFVNPTAGTVLDGLVMMGPHQGPAKIRIARGGSGAGGTAWTTAAPAVIAVRVGGQGTTANVSLKEPNA